MGKTLSGKETKTFDHDKNVSEELCFGLELVYVFLPLYSNIRKLTSIFKKVTNVFSSWRKPFPTVFLFQNKLTFYSLKIYDERKTYFGQYYSTSECRYYITIDSLTKIKISKKLQNKWFHQVQFPILLIRLGLIRGYFCLI